MPTPDAHVPLFEQQRRRLAGLAYRMTGSVADSEDILQQAWIRFADQDLSTLIEPPRWLSTVVTRLCLDHLKSARMTRETYVGPWLPDPLVQDQAADAEQDWILTEDVSVALILTLNTLSPEMRAAFLLRDAFDYEFEDISAVVGRSAVACRQLVSRARRRLAGAEPPDPVSLRDAEPIVSAFWRASRAGDMDQLVALLEEDIELHSDGGGKVRSTLNVLHGIRRVAGFFQGLARKKWISPAPLPPLCLINGAPGYVWVDQEGVKQTVSFAIRNRRISAIWIMRNPDKLRHVSVLQDIKEKGGEVRS